MLQRLKYKMFFYTYSGDMLYEGMVERVLLCYIEVVNVTKIEVKIVFYNYNRCLRQVYRN